MIRRKKKGFTIVELVIVIAVIGILAAILIPTFVSLNDKANKAADDSLVHNLNTAMSIEEGEGKKNNTYNDAIEYLDNYGYRLANLATRAGHDLLWNSKTNRFLLNEQSEFDKDQAETGAKDVDYWTIKDSIPTERKFSIYAGLGWNDENPVTLNGIGFDAGKHSLSSISYSNTGDAKDVTIRTNSASTTLTVNAPSDDIHHYGALGALNIVKAKTASYHENGKVAYVEIAYGRIVLEKGADIEEIHINKKENEQAFDTVIIANNGGTEELPDRITRDAVQVTAKTEVVTVESNGSSEIVYVYVNGTTGTTEKVTEGDKQNENVNSALGQLVLDNGSNPGEKAQTTEQKQAAKTEAVETAIEKENYKGDVYILLDGDAPDAGRYATFAEFRDEVNGLNGKEANTFAGYTVTLQVNVDLGGVEWTPIGTSEHPFSGAFDGQNHVIKNYKIRGEGENVGLALFGFIEGTNNTDVATFTKDTPLSNFYNTSTYTVYLPSEDVFTCAVKNLNVANADVNTTADGWTAAVVAYVNDATVANVHLSNSTLVANEKIGGIVGYLPSNVCCFITNCSTASNVTITTNTGNHCAGILSRIYTDQSHAIIANCVNNATVNCYGQNGAGIAGQAKGVLYYNDTNNGAVTTSKNRAAGIATDCSGGAFINCTNTGYIKANGTVEGDSGSIAGIGSYFASSSGTVVVNCMNSGTIEGTTSGDKSKIAGIVGNGLADSSIILNNANTGKLINHAEGGKVYDICNLSSVPYVVEPSDLAELNVATATDNKYVKVTNSITLANGKTIAVNGQEKLEFVNSPSYLTIDLSNSNEKSFVLMVNNTIVTLVNGSGKIVTVSGKGNTVVVEAEQSIKSLRVSNEDAQVGSSLDFAGTADIILLNGAGLVNAEVKAGATVGRVCFGGTGTFVLTNRGTISHKTEGQYGAEHTIDTITASNITIYNHGTIEAKKNSNDVCSYALLFYGGATVKFYAYEGSMVRQEIHSAMAISGGTTIDFYYQEGAGLNIYGNDYTYPQTFNYGDSNITVTEMN